jgi:hypothetical protein
MAWAMTKREFSAAHEVGHALVLHHFGCIVNSISNVNSPEWKIEPITYAEEKALEPYDDMLCRAAGVAGVMFWRGQLIAPYIKCDYVRILFSERFVCYFLSRRGWGDDRNKIEKAHFAKYGRIPSDASYYMYASAAVDIIATRKELFARCHGALVEHHYISKLNFQNLVAGRPFDVEENRLTKSLTDWRDYFES